MQIGAANARVGDFDVNVGLFPGLGLILLPNHFALGGLGVQAHPSFKFVVGRHDESYAYY